MTGYLTAFIVWLTMWTRDEVVFRHADYSLTDEQRALRETFATMLTKECPTDRVRAAEPFGFDDQLWEQLTGLGAASLGVPAEHGGDGGGLVELALVAEQLGRALTPVPFVEVAVAARLLARCGPGADAWLRAAMAGERVVTIALQRRGDAQLVAAGAVADAVIGMVGDDLVLATSEARPAPVRNHASAPLAAWDMAGTATSRQLLLDGSAAVEAFQQARREWKLLMAAALIGLADGALELAADFARERRAFGVPIASFQAVAHPLADCAIAIAGGRRLVWKAAWLADHEPRATRELIPMAFLHASRTAVRATTVGVHTQGGVGFTLESPMQLFFRRAKGWANVAGDPAGERRLIADALYGPASV